MRKSVFARACTACLLVAFCGAARIGSSAQTLTTLYTFDYTHGSGPNSPLVQGLNGDFYGTTDLGGESDSGTAFKMTPQGTLTDLDSFCSDPIAGCSSLYGAYPRGLILGLDGNFYGLTYEGGANSNISICQFGCGTVFKITPGGTLSLVYDFCAQQSCTDGAEPTSLLQGPDGNFYGTTSLAGANTTSCELTGYYCGTIFKLTPQGVLTTLYSFCSQKNCEDGSIGVSLLAASNGNFYGTTDGGGPSAYGVIFELTPTGNYSVLQSFPFGYGPDFNSLTEASNGELFGVSRGNNSASYPGYVFRLTLSGKFEVLYSFCRQTGCPDGSNPAGGLVQGTDGNLYGTTVEGGLNNSDYCFNGCGTIFSISPQGKFTNLYNFCSLASCADGYFPDGTLIQGTDGKFYGATSEEFYGAIFSFDVGLGPYIEALPGYGKVGQSTRILGNGLTGTTGVSFNGTPAAFKVVGDTVVTATVPAGATTGAIELTTSSGTLSTNAPFLVRN